MAKFTDSLWNNMAIHQMNQSDYEKGGNMDSGYYCRFKRSIGCSRWFSYVEWFYISITLLLV